MERNVELLEKTMRYIMDHPEKHQQGTWVSDCGTAACFAGWAMMLTGTPADKVKIIAEGAGDMVLTAGNLLGLDHHEAYTLFRACNTRPMLELMVKDLINGAPLRHANDYCTTEEVRL